MTGNLSYYLLDTIDVKPDQMQRFIEIMYQLINGAFREQGWKLVSATYAVTGRPTTVTHLWSIPSANSVLETMLKLADNATYVALMACVDSEEQQILTPMIYNPDGDAAADSSDDHR